MQGGRVEDIDIAAAAGLRGDAQHKHRPTWQPDALGLAAATYSPIDLHGWRQAAHYEKKRKKYAQVQG